MKKLAWEAQTPIPTVQRVTKAHVRDFIIPLHVLRSLGAER